MAGATLRLRAVLPRCGPAELSRFFPNHRNQRPLSLHPQQLLGQPDHRRDPGEITPPWVPRPPGSAINANFSVCRTELDRSFLEEYFGTVAEERRYTSKDAREKAGLSYRQLNDWESRGALPPGGRESERGWRRFSPKELFALMVCAEVRERYGIPVEKVRYVLECMMREDADHFQAALELMSFGLNIFLLTDFKETFVMDSDLEFEDYMTYGYFRADRPQAYIFMRLNDIAARLLESPDKVKSSIADGLYAVKMESRAAITVKNQPEIDLLQALRSGNFDHVSVKVKNGDIRVISLEGDVPKNDVSEQADGVRVKSENEFETFEVSKAGGQVIKARRKLPKKYTPEDNQAVLFAGIHNREEPKDDSSA